MASLATVTGTIKALAAHVCARKDDAGSRSIATIVKEGATETDGTTNSLSDNYLYFTDYYDTNPDTASAWTITEVNGMEAGIKLIS